MEFVRDRGVALLDDEVIVPLTIDAHAVVIGQETQRFERCQLVLVFVLPARLRADLLSGLDLMETHAGHSPS